jgi:methyltransferase (TIGR00027 family)
VVYDGSASGTATAVTVLRAIASTGKRPLLSDHASLALLPRPFAGAIRLLARTRPGSALLWLAPDALIPGRLLHIGLRTSLIDEHLQRELTRAPSQVVFLGAGFDTRAYRMRELDRALVFEIDHPATQRKKRRLASGLSLAARGQRFVAVDFERDALAPLLEAAGFERGVPSVFVWEGVTMYLTLEAIRTTLSALFELMAPGSCLIVTYYDASGASGPPSPATEAIAFFLGEPFRTRLAPAEARALLAEFGFDVESDTGRDEWASARGRTPRGSAQERIAIARRTSR